MQLRSRSSRFVALSTGAVLALGVLGAAPAQAMEKSKKLKYGAIAAGVASAYLLSKGKTVPAAAVAAGGYYAYKKSEKARDEERFGSYRDDDRYGYNPDRVVYPDDYEEIDQYRTNAIAGQSKRQIRAKYDLKPYLR